MPLISIDPVTIGTRNNCGGWGVFEDEVLRTAGAYSDIDGLPYVPPGKVVKVVVEVPQFYELLRSKGDPNQLIRLAYDAGRAAATLAQGVEPAAVTPPKWKGSTPKDVLERRIWKVLSAKERTSLEGCLKNVRPSWHHNVIEAVGIGLWFLKRLAR